MKINSKPSKTLIDDFVRFLDDKNMKNGCFPRLVLFRINEIKYNTIVDDAGEISTSNGPGKYVVDKVWRTNVIPSITPMRISRDIRIDDVVFVECMFAPSIATDGATLDVDIFNDSKCLYW